MDQDAIESFVSWFTAQSERLAALRTALARSTEESRDAEVAASLFQELEQEIAPRLEAVEEGLLFEVGPGLTNPHALIISAGGMLSLAPAVTALTARLDSVPHWDVIAFKPARKVDETSSQTAIFDDRTVEVSPSQVRAHLSPGLIDVGVSLYFDGFEEDDLNIWGQVGFNFLDFILGELSVMTAVGELRFLPLDEAPDSSFPLTELGDRFASALAELRSREQLLLSGTAAERLKGCLPFVAAALEELAERGTDDGDELFFTIHLWSRDERACERIAASLPHAEVDATERRSALGEGFRISVLCSAPSADFDPRSWLLAHRDQLLERSILIGIEEQGPPNPFLTQLIASQLLEAGDAEGAITLLKRAAARLSDDDGQLACLLGMAYLNAGRHDEALQVYERAIARVDDPELKGEMLTNQGCALQRIGRLDEALEAFEQALALDPEKYVRQYNLGQAFAAKGDAARACAHLRAAIEANPALAAHLHSDPDLAPIRGSAELKELISELGV